MILEATVKRNIDELKQQGSEHLASGLEHQLVPIKALIADLHTNAVTEDQRKSLVEGQLSNLENRYSEEMAAIQMAKQHQHKGQSVEELIKQAEDLITKTQSRLRQFSTDDKDVSAPQNEVSVIGQLVARLRANPKVEDTKKVEQQLLRHVHILDIMLKRI